MKRKRNAQGGIVLIKKANNLIESRYKFDIWETRFFLSVLGQIRKDDEEFQVYRIWYKDVIKAFGLKSGDSYNFLRTAAKSLMGKSFFVSYEDEGVTREKQYHILREIDYLKDGQEGKTYENHEYIDVTVEQKMKPLLLQLQKNFTAYDMRNVMKLGVYPIRVYELLKQYESIGSRRLDVEEVKRMFEVSEQYKLFGDFFRWVVQPSIRDINAHTDLNVYKVDKITEGRRVVALHFYFRKKDPADLESLHADKNTGKQLDLFGEAKTKKQPIEVPGTAENPTHESYFERLNDWWGIEREEFFKRVAGKEEKDIETAIQFTKFRIKAEKAQNPAGVFLDALSKGHKTPEQFKLEKKEEAARKQQEKQAALEPLVKAYERLMDDYTQAINDGIREITQAKPEVTESVIERIKTTYLALGDKKMQGKSIEEFRKNPMLRGLVKAEIMKDFPERFSAVNSDFGKRIQEAKGFILEVDADFRFV